MIRPQALKKGDTIGIAAPASPFDRGEFEKGVQLLKSLNFNVKFQEDLFETHRYLAGTDARRGAELMSLFEDPEVKAILFARGGYGTLRILSGLDWDKIQKNPKIVLGYSDLTPLLVHLNQKFSWVVFHGPVVAKAMGDLFQESGKTSLFKSLTQTQALGEIKPASLIYLKPGKAQGMLMGGCLSLLIATLKTPYEIQTEDKILFLEDVNEKPYKIDRMLTQLKLAGKLNQVKGFIFGPLKKGGGSDEEMQQVILDVLGNFSVPIAYGFPSGHLDNMLTLPFGVPVEMDSDKGSLCFTEEALQESL